MLLKAWMTYESNLLGSHAAAMATYALYTIVIFLINNFYEELQSPMDVFWKFFEYFSTYRWTELLLTIYGPIYTKSFQEELSKEDGLSPGALAVLERKNDPDLKDKKLLFAPGELDFKELQDFVVNAGDNKSQVPYTEQKKLLRLKYINLLDPCEPSNNLGKSISLFNSHRLREAIKL